MCHLNSLVWKNSACALRVFFFFVFFSLPSFWANFTRTRPRKVYLWPEGRSPRVGTLSGAIRENGASWGPLNGPPSFPAPVKRTHLSEALRAFPGLSGASGKGFPTPRITETRGRIPRPLRGPKTSGPLSRVSPLLFRPSGRN